MESACTESFSTRRKEGGRKIRRKEEGDERGETVSEYGERGHASVRPVAGIQSVISAERYMAGYLQSVAH